jgi:predicted branched-subunit amino acid permease
MTNVSNEKKILSKILLIYMFWNIKSQKKIKFNSLHFHYFSFGFFDFMMIASFVTLVVFMWIGSGQLNLKL